MNIKVKVSPKLPRVKSCTEKLNQMMRQMKSIQLFRLTLFILRVPVEDFSIINNKCFALADKSLSAL